MVRASGSPESSRGRLQMKRCPKNRVSMGTQRRRPPNAAFEGIGKEYYTKEEVTILLGLKS